ncbi:hypothetical protein F5876DRAFT_40738 [Lentinula aff. lateritia]|uniref:Uncharacterized protein n=1 Tax=Lentinula aff. lateritia TaxID=2804960 RepID=A0ACC1U1K4_9AGAR|nr:hypothetical protein F5876DRAFT_40738 [Lentinula aff. lateritia]
MDILLRWYPEYKHVFVYDNAPSHLKRPDGTLSARKMPKGPSDKFFPEVNQRDANGNLVHRPDGKVAKVKMQMEPATFANGKPQSLYFPIDHPKAGWFKGIDEILSERGISTAGKKLECPKFKCPAESTDCCARRMLFSQPDFINVPSILEAQCQARGFDLILLPKFHCELNPIEQCWGYAKRIYRFYPESSREEDLRKNTLEALEQVPLLTIRRFFTQSMRFMDAYARGLNGRQAAWAARKYKGHCVLPESIMNELFDQNIT